MATVTRTETPAVAPESATEEARPRPYRISVDLYDRMVEAGVFGDKSPIYLWKGQLVEPMTKGPPHEFALSAINDLMVRLVTDGWHVRPGSPTRLNDDSEPEPDLSVVRGSRHDYKARHPRAGDVVLAVEVADSSRRFDMGEKLEAYAAASIPVYWVVNLPENRLDVYTGPTGPAGTPGYKNHQRFGPNDDVAVVLDGREVGRAAVNDVLP